MGRSLPALQEGYFQVDEMKFEDLLAMAADYSKILTFYGLDNRPEGDWEPFFSADESVINAQILATDLGQVRSGFAGWLVRSMPLFRPATDLSQMDWKEIPAFDLAHRLDWWLNQLQFNQLRSSESDECRELKEKIAGAIDGKLADELRSLAAFLEQFNINADFESSGELGGIWSVAGNPGVIPPEVLPPWDDHAGRDRIERFLTLNFYSFYHSISSLKTTSANLLPASLRNGTHNPAAAMYIAFVRLFNKAQTEANRFTGKHLDLYYYDILKARPQAWVPDSAYLILYPDVGQRRALVKKGTEFLAGTGDSNQPLIYTADNDLIVHGAGIRELRTLYFQRDPRKSPENQLDYASGARSFQIPVPPGNPSAPGDGDRPWPLFGMPKDNADDVISENARIGFALASPILYLNQGERNLSFLFRIEYLAFAPFRVTDLLDALGLANKLRDGSDLLSRHLREAFSAPVRSLLDEFDGATLSESLRQALPAELNQLSRGDLLYDEQRFASVDLTAATLDLIGQRPQGREVSRVNRMLLEEAYPEELRANRYLDYVLEELTDDLRFASREDAFFKAFAQMFTIQLTGAGGWLEVGEYLPLIHLIDRQLDEDLLKIQFQLGPEVEPIVSYSPELHGGGFNIDLPVVKFLINPTSYLYPYDLLNKMEINNIEIVADVGGVRDILLYNSLGQLDPDAPFNPFGPLPSLGSYWIVGSPEIARKQITSLNVNVEWGGVPAAAGGFQEYYQGYGMPFGEEMYEASVTVLSDGKWMPAEEHRQPRVKLFDSMSSDQGTSTGYGGRAATLSSGEEVTRFFKPVTGSQDEPEYGYNSRANNGFIKFTLAGPEQAFGHKEYPQQLTQVLTENARQKGLRSHRPIPNPPYTPLINTASLDYQAVATIDLGRVKSSVGSRLEERIYYIHPFGWESVSPANSGSISMVPRYDSSGNLFLGLSARSLIGPLTLFFHLREDCSPEAGAPPTRSSWSYLSSNRWIELDQDRVISDTTNGFLTSGIVTLELPDGITSDNTVMTPDLFWLRVSVDDHPEYLCSVYSIHSQALKVTGQTSSNSSQSPPGKLPAGTIKDPRISIPGIDRVDQPLDSFGGRVPETPDRLKTRLSERLRHKNRALVPWDYERLILDQFPEMFLVKCFSNMVPDPENPRRRGHILIVVIPDPRENPSLHLKPMVNGLTLSKIADFVEGRSSPMARIKVRNPSYEQVQVRCTVKFREGTGGGYYIRAVDQAISNYLSPWNSSGGNGAQFGWSIRCNDVETLIRNLEYVESVTNFSMLHIAEDDQNYSVLMDTVLMDAVRGKVELEEIGPLFPWSIAIPARRHAIETSDNTRPIRPERTGINELRIGTTLIITEKNNHGHQE